jgi:heme-degrading monooxygenase HmoA
MPAFLIRHKIADFAVWKPIFDEQSGYRAANGSLGGRVFRNHADPDEVLILLEWDALERAELFALSADQNDALVHAGVTDHPDIWLLREVDRPTH